MTLENLMTLIIGGAVLVAQWLLEHWQLAGLLLLVLSASSALTAISRQIWDVQLSLVNVHETLGELHDKLKTLEDAVEQMSNEVEQIRGQSDDNFDDDEIT